MTYYDSWDEVCSSNRQQRRQEPTTQRFITLHLNRTNPDKLTLFVLYCVCQKYVSLHVYKKKDVRNTKCTCVWFWRASGAADSVCIALVSLDLCPLMSPPPPPPLPALAAAVARTEGDPLPVLLLPEHQDTCLIFYREREREKKNP